MKHRIKKVSLIAFRTRSCSKISLCRIKLQWNRSKNRSLFTLAIITSAEKNCRQNRSKNRQCKGAFTQTGRRPQDGVKVMACLPLLIIYAIFSRHFRYCSPSSVRRRRENTSFNVGKKTWVFFCNSYYVMCIFVHINNSQSSSEWKLVIFIVCLYFWVMISGRIWLRDNWVSILRDVMQQTMASYLWVVEAIFHEFENCFNYKKSSNNNGVIILIINNITWPMH